MVDHSDLILPLSQKTLIIFNNIAPTKEFLYVADGTDTNYFSNFPVAPQENTILFYGAMSSKQNVRAFFRLYNNILPKIKDKVPLIKLLIVGANPTTEIKMLNNGEDVIVTGFVEDVRPWLAKAWLKILPLELGSGFRGRVVELMSMGIPVVGTHNALDSLGFENGKEGFISDSDDELASISLKILTDTNIRNELSKNARGFAAINYSLEATFGKLTEYLKQKFN